MRYLFEFWQIFPPRFRHNAAAALFSVPILAVAYLLMWLFG